MVKVGELREQIAQNAKRIRYKFILEKIAYISDLCRRAMDDEECRTLTDEEWERYIIIKGVLRLEEMKSLSIMHTVLQTLERTEIEAKKKRRKTA